MIIGSGVCWSTSAKPTTKDSKTMNETFSGIFTSDLTGLEQGRTYYVRAYATYDNDTTIYGNELSFKTSFEPGTGTQKTDLPGGARNFAVGFSIGSKVYIGLGYFESNDDPTFYKDFWEWDQATDAWTQKADLPGNGREGAVGVSIGNKGYIATGLGGNPYHYLQDLWEYDPSIK